MIYFWLYLVGSESIDLESLVAYGRRIAAHVRSPPEYNDSSGTDGLCVPGYFFPCPDNLTISRSVLFQADKIRAVSPTISFTPDPRTRAMYWVSALTIDEINDDSKIQVFFGFA